MAEKKPAANGNAPAEKKKPTSAALQAAIAQLEEEETGKKKNTALLRVGALVLWLRRRRPCTCLDWPVSHLPSAPRSAIDLPQRAERGIVDIVVAGVLGGAAARCGKSHHIPIPTKSLSRCCPVI